MVNPNLSTAAISIAFSEVVCDFNDSGACSVRVCRER